MHHNQPPGKPENQPPGREKSVTLNLGNSSKLLNLYESGAREELSLRGEEEAKTPGAGPDSPLRLPLTEYLLWAAREHQRHMMQRRGWETSLWHFTRLARAHPDLFDRNAMEAFRLMNELMRRWISETSQPDRDPWAVFLAASQDGAEVEIVETWEKVRHLPGCNPYEAALAQSEREPIELPWEHRQGRPAAYLRFIALAGWLQVAVGARPILLPVEPVGKVLGIPKMSVSRLRTRALEDGYLREVRKHDHAKRLATEFLFDVSRVPVLAGRAEPGTAELYRGEPYLPGLAKEVVEHYLKATLSPHGSAGAIECVRYHFHRGRTVEQLKAVVDRFVKDQARLGRTPHHLCSAKNFFAPGMDCDCLLEEVEEQQESRPQG